MKKSLISLFAFFALVLIPAGIYAASATYRVQNGDTWESIAAKKGVSLQALVDSNQPRRGTTLNIPVASTPAPTPSPVPPPTPTPSPAPAVNGQSKALSNVWITGYADGDNTPPESPVTFLNGKEGVAGGDCTYDNPTTLAVGHVITNGNDVGDFAYGTKFYVPVLQCYFSAQDTCGDGNTPQNGACHKPEQGSLQLDAYVGAKGTASCEENMTDLYNVIQNPLPGLPVKQGTICR